MDEATAKIASGLTALGIELGSTRIKAVLVDLHGEVLATGGFDWENQFVDRIWTYPLDLVWQGLAGAFRSLAGQVETRYAIPLETIGSIGISAMMHGYLPFDEEDSLLVPFRTWRNSMTGDAAALLTRLFNFNVPQRWCAAHLAQAILNKEPHVPQITHLTTLAGLVHWKLTGRKVIGVGDASGMFPIDPLTAGFDTAMLDKFEEYFADRSFPWRIDQILPEVLPAGRPAGALTEAGARLLDPTGRLQPGIPFAPPEGDGATGMVATNSVLPGTGNTSVGTSVFTMVVMTHPLREVHVEIDIINTPAGDPVAMVHCNNGASEVNEWAGVFAEFARAIGSDADTNEVFSALFASALNGAPDCGGLLSYNYLAGEVITELDEGRPLFVRTPDSDFSFGQLHEVPAERGVRNSGAGYEDPESEQIQLDVMFAHGGLFRTRGVAQRLLAAALNTPVTVAETAGDGGSWGMAVLAAYLIDGSESPLSEYLDQTIFAAASSETIDPAPDAVAGFAAYLRKYEQALPIIKAAVAST